MTFAVKDVFDIVGVTPSAGVPDWERTHAPALRNAPAVQRLLDAGAALDGCALLDELCCSMSGVNVHYGTPLNPAAPERLPGGSSGGSAAAVASGDVDFALGTDTSGSVRLPAAWCGVYGMRPSHGAVPAEGVFPLAPTFDTVGWMARDAHTLRRVGEMLLSPEARPTAAGPRGTGFRLLVAIDLLDWVDEAVRQALLPGVRRLMSAASSTVAVQLLPSLGMWLETHSTGVHVECVEQHAAWIETIRPRLGPDVGQRMRDMTPLDEATRQQARVSRAHITRQLDALLGEDGLLCLPTSYALPPLRDTAAADLLHIELRSIALGCIASLAGLPQVSCPWGAAAGIPVGLALAAPRGHDRWLLQRVEQLEAQGVVGRAHAEGHGQGET